MPRARRRAYPALAAALVGSCLLARPRGSPAAVHDVITHRFAHGLTLHIAADHDAPVAAVQAWVGAGSADEPPPLAGLAHLVEHMLFKGVGAEGSGGLVGAIERGGGEINAWTARDHTVYHAALGAVRVDAAVEAAVDALGDALTAPRVDPEELAREREVVLEEIRHSADDPARAVAQALFATAYAAHPYRRPVLGAPETLRHIGERDVVDFFRAHYVADNVTLAVAGAVDPERVRRAVERRFRHLPAGRPARLAAPEPPQTAPRATAIAREVGEAYLALGFHAPPARHPDVAALEVAAILLGQSESARLPRLLRDRDQVVTSAYAAVHALRDPGLFVLSATAPPTAGGPIRAVRALAAAAGALAAELTDDELAKARLVAEAAVTRQLETVQGRARALGWHATIAGEPHFAHVHLDRIRAVRRADVARAVARYLRPETASVAALLPPAAARRGAFPGAAERALERGLGGAAPAAAAAAITERRVALPSGAVVIVRRDPAAPVVAMRAIWRGGQRAEDAAHAGASTLLARLLVRGCAGRDAAAVADRIDRLGGSLVGVAGRNSFGLAAEWLAGTWRGGLDLLADCVVDPTLPAAELGREARLLRDDQLAQDASPAHAAFRLFGEALYGQHPYARDPLGSPAVTAGLGSAQLAAFYRERYPLSGLVLAIVGDVDLEDAIALATARLGARPAARVAALPPAPVRPAAAAEVYRYLERSQAHLVVGFPGARLDAPDRFALEVLVAVLGGQGGRLFGELRERRALAYRVAAHGVEGIDPGFLAVYLACSPEKLPAAVAAVRAELARVRAGGITEAEVARAREQLVAGHRIAMQRRAAVAHSIAYHEVHGLGWQAWAAYEARIGAVTTAEVAAAAVAYLRADREVIATVRPPAASPAAARRSRAAKPPRPAPAPARRPAARPRPNA
jgi:zinc protease